MVLVPFLLYLRFERSSTVPVSAARQKGTSRLVVLLSLASLVLFAILKLTLQTRARLDWGLLRRRKVDLILDTLRNTASTFFHFNLGRYGIGLPATAWRTLRCRPGLGIAGLALLFAVAVFSYMVLAARRSPRWPGMNDWLLLMLAGVIIFALGHSIFSTPFLQESANLGANNRIDIAAALGTPFLLVGAFGAACSLLPNSKTASRCFCALVTLIAASGFTVVQGVASYWVEAAGQQRLILEDISSRVRALPPKSTLLLDGFCAYTGPGIVFETDWDTSAALQMLFRDASIRGDVIGRQVKVNERNITTLVYGEENRYSYQDHLWVYNYTTKRLWQLTTFEIARTYFEGHNPQRNRVCDAAREGYGTATCFSR